MKLLEYTSLLTGLLLFVMSTTADTCKKVADSTGICTHAATARDFAGTDGCRILLELDNGQKLLAVNLGEYSPPLEDGEKVRISFEKADDMVSICMVEDSIVHLTCLARQSGPDWLVDCPTIVDPYRVTWAAKVMKEINPRQVEELIVDGHRMYRFYAPSGARVYSCHGELLCTVTYNTREACAEIEKKTSEVRIIYVVNE